MRNLFQKIVFPTRRSMHVHYIKRFLSRGVVIPICFILLFLRVIIPKFFCFVLFCFCLFCLFVCYFVFFLIPKEATPKGRYSKGLYVTRCHKMSIKLQQLLFKIYYRFKFFVMQVLKWYMICGYSPFFCPAKIDVLCWFSFVLYCSVTCLTGHISVYKLVTFRSFCGRRSHIWNIKGTNGRQKTYEIVHVYCIFYYGFMCRTIVIFGITKDWSLVLNTLA